ncbi:MAG: hypothetical protein ACK559_41725, partial [bacterium]
GIERARVSADRRHLGNWNGDAANGLLVNGVARRAAALVADTLQGDLVDLRAHQSDVDRL